MILLWSTGAMLAGFALDMLLGDPHNFPHIVRWFGGLIAALDRRLPRSVAGGTLLVVLVTVCCAGIPLAVLIVAYRVFLPAGFVIESILCWQLLAAKSLKTESMKVYRALYSGDTEAARHSVSMIVGRDTAALDADGITRAAVETVAENASDGVTAPLLFIMLGGAAAGCLYKAVNTMDSMVGYKNEKYLLFGRAAAKTDDALNCIPSRLCALFMIAGANLLGYDGNIAHRIWRRDRRKHASPNSAQTESVCAGALNIRLAGPASYHGKILDKPYIGDDTRPVEPEDIARANRLMYASSAITLAIAVLFRLIMIGVVYA